MSRTLAKRERPPINPRWTSDTHSEKISSSRKRAAFARILLSKFTTLMGLTWSASKKWPTSSS
eukprot:8734874-Pyramimonas_sp.AAC.1